MNGSGVGAAFGAMMIVNSFVPSRIGIISSRRA